MMDYITLGVAPVNEDVVAAPYQTSETQILAYKQADRFAAFLENVFGEPPLGRFEIKECLYSDFFYYDVLLHFNTSDEASSNYAYIIEAKTPDTWANDAPYVWPEETPEEMWVRLHRLIMLKNDTSDDIYIVEDIANMSLLIKKHNCQDASLKWVSLSDVDSEIPWLRNSLPAPIVNNG